MTMNDPWKTDHPTSHLDFSEEAKLAKYPELSLYLTCVDLLENALDGSEEAKKELIEIIEKECPSDGE